ncbi:MAG: sacsin N-terminal ATP-binding-like domain-containing protein [Thermoproteota archaeon]
MSSVDEKEAYNHITEIQRSYITRKDRVSDSLSGAMWIVEKMFTRTGHFVLEFIQNAEDARARKVKVILQPNFVKIFNDGLPFSRDDVEAICSIGRSRKDPREYVGYLGVGFKAVFLVSSKPHVYSKPYRFKFDRDFWPDPRLVPWQITPIWLEDVPEECREWNVVFYIPIDKEGYERIRNELERLAPTTLLFLHNVVEIELNFDEKRKVFKKEEKEGGICDLEVTENGSKTLANWIVFRELIKVPEQIKNDKFTKDWNREMIEKREIAVAFRLDENNDLTPITGTIKFGVFSYVPLREEEIGMPFLIHGDFLVAPGREIVQREAPWNKWMLEEVAKFVINSVINSFKAHDTWKYSYTNVLCSTIYHSPFDTYLANPINNEIRSGDHLVDLEGNFIKSSEAIEIEEKILDTLSADFLEKVVNKRILHPKTKPHHCLSVERIESVKDLGRYFTNIESVKNIFREGWRDALRDYLRALAKEWFEYAESTRRSYYYQSNYSATTYLIDEKDSLCQPGYIYIPTSDEIEQKTKELFPEKFRFLHHILREDIIVRFLKEIGVKELTKEDLERLIKKEQIPMLIDELKNPKTHDQRRIEIVESIERFWKEGIVSSDELLRKDFLIRTKTGKWLKPKEILLSSEYNPDTDIERLVINGLLDFELEFLDPVFIHGKSLEEKSEWLRFLKELNLGAEIKEEQLVERVGILASLKYEREKCGCWDAQPLAESERGKGYDIKSRMTDGSPKYIEVKASKGEWSITLTKAEYRFILENPEHTYLYVITNALKSPELHGIPGNLLKDMIPSVTLVETDWESKTQFKWKPLG